MTGLPEGVTLPGGRVAWPAVLQYRLRDGRLLDLPPDYRTHPDRAAESRAGGGLFEPSLPYETIVHDVDAYERLLRAGALTNPPHTRPGGVTADRRATAGAG